MTKTITIPLSKETCDKIKKGIGLGLWGLATIGLIFGFISMWYDTLDWGNSPARELGGAFFFLGISVSIIMMIVCLHDKGIWVNFRCNCEVEEK